MPRSLIMAMGIMLCFNLMSCDLFKTRTPEEPSQQSSTYISLTDASSVLQNMIDAFQDGNDVNYAKSFSDASFSFVPSTNAQNKYGVDWTSWNKAQEQQCFDKILKHFLNNSRVVLAFDPYTPIYNNGTYQVETIYHITLPIESGIIKKFNGQVQFTLAQDQYGSWSISRWVDVGTDSTWSDLKGVAYSQWY
jgi:hypothetical protein